MDTMENPFFNRKRITDSRYFVGRETEIKRIFRAIKTGQSLSIVGPRRIGKSSLLTHVYNPEVRAKHKVDEKHILVYINCQELTGEVTQTDVYQKLGRELINVSGLKLTRELPQVTNFLLLQQLIKQIADEGKSIVFLLDEFEILASNGTNLDNNDALDADFFSQLRALSETQPVIYLTASHETLYDLSYRDKSVLGSPFFNIFPLLRLGLMTTHEAQLLITTLLRLGSSIQFNEADFQFVRHCAGTHPFFIQIVSDLLFEVKLSYGEVSGQLLIDRDMNSDDRTEMLNYINGLFNIREFRTLCLSLGEDYDNLPGGEKQSKVRELILKMSRAGRIPDLIKQLAEARPYVAWANTLGESPSVQQDKPEYGKLEQDFLEQVQQHFNYIWQQLGMSMQVTLQAICKRENVQLTFDEQRWGENRCLLYEGKLFSATFAKFVLDQVLNHETVPTISTQMLIGTLKIVGELTPIQRVVVQKLFEGEGIETAELTLLAREYANFGVYRVELKSSQQETPLYQVLKFASAKDIDQEKENYARWVKDKLGIVFKEQKTYWLSLDINRIPKEEWSRELAAVVYPYAQTSGDKVTTLERAYTQVLASSSLANPTTKNQISTAFDKLFDALDKWQDYAPTHKPLPSLRGVYGRLGYKLAQTEDQARDLPELGFAKPRFASLRSKKKFLWRGKKYINPIYWADRLFSKTEEPIWLKELAANCPLGLVHGNLNYRNILIDHHQDESANICLLDFANTHEGHVLRDYGTLEAELKCLLTPLEAKDFTGGTPPILQLEQLLLTPEFRDTLDLEQEAVPAICQQNPKLLGIWTYVRLIRRRAREKYLLGADVRPYYLSLLHATLPIVYYTGLSEWQRLYAFLSAALICEKLDALNSTMSSAETQQEPDFVPRLRPKILHNFKGFIKIEILNEYGDLVVNNEDSYVLSPQAKGYFLRVTIQTQEPTSGLYRAITVDKGQDVDPVVFTVDVGTISSLRNKSSLELAISPLQGIKSEVIPLTIDRRGESYVLVVGIKQQTALIQAVPVQIKLQ